MQRVLRTSGALLRAQSKNYTAAAAYSALPQPQTTPDVLYTGVSTWQLFASNVNISLLLLIR